MSEAVSRRRAAGIFGAAATSLLIGEARGEQANVGERVTRLIVEHMDVDRHKVKPETTFTALGADSLDCVELTMAVEEEFSVVVDDQAAIKIKTVGDMIRHIEASPKAPPSPSRNDPSKK
jgi:acyl carrier protein